MNPLLGIWPEGAVRAFALNSRAFSLALDALRRVAPDEASRVVREVNDYARDLRHRAEARGSAEPEPVAGEAPGGAAEPEGREG